MISTVRGSLLQTGLDWVVVEVGGLGLRVLTAPGTVSKLPPRGQEVFLETYLVVRDDALTLYGFASAAEREMFEVLLGVSGIGPRTALGALAVLTPAELAGAIEQADLAVLQRVPGVGRKSAQRMVLELGGKLPSGIGASPDSQLRTEVAAALEQLGWGKPQVDKTLAGLDGDYPDASAMLRAALLVLGSHRG